jgi:methylated-DNA-[protein]-cysteine S-methyltransferase
MIHYRTIDSPIGLLTLAGRGSALTNLRMVDQTYEPSRADWSADPGAFNDGVHQLRAISAGRLSTTSMSSWICAVPNSSSGCGRRC